MRTKGNFKLTEKTASGTKGMAVVELMIGFVIVGVIGSIAMPHYVDYTKATRAATCTATRYNIRKATIHYLNANDSAPGDSLPTMEQLVSDGLLYEVPTCLSNGSFLWIDEAVAEGKTPDLGCSIHYWPSLAETKETGAEPLYSSSFDSMEGLKKLSGSWKALNGALISSKGGRISFGSSEWSDFDMIVNATNLKGKGYDIYYRGELNAKGKKFQAGYKLKFDAKKKKIQVKPIVNGKEKKAIATYSLPKGFPSKGQSHDIGISVKGSSHTISIDGQSVMSFTDSKYSSGVAGFKSGKNQNTFNNVSVNEQTA